MKKPVTLYQYVLDHPLILPLLISAAALIIWLSNVLPILLDNRLSDDLVITHMKFAAVYLLSILVLIFIFLVIIKRNQNHIARAIQAIDSINKGDISLKLAGSGRGMSAAIISSLEILLSRLNRNLVTIMNEAATIKTESDEMAASSIAASVKLKKQSVLSKEVIEIVAELAQLINTMAEVSNVQGDDLSKLANLIKSFTETSLYIASTINEIVVSAAALAEKSSDGRKILTAVSDNILATVNDTQDINSVLDVISDISDRINLLSLNAAIEAARAGDAGRGFAVVADEISKLADQTAGSVAEIGKMINEKNRKLGDNSDSIKTAISTVDVVMVKVQDLSTDLKKLERSVLDQGKMNEFVVKEAGKISDKSEEIENTAIEQKLKIYDTVNYVNRLNEFSIEINTGAEDVTRKAEIIKEMTNKFSAMIGSFLKA